jgi:hypothetical protein
VDALLRILNFILIAPFSGSFEALCPMRGLGNVRASAPNLVATCPAGPNLSSISATTKVQTAHCLRNKEARSGPPSAATEESVRAGTLFVGTLFADSSSALQPGLTTLRCFSSLRAAPAKRKSATTIAKIRAQSILMFNGPPRAGTSTGFLRILAAWLSRARLGPLLPIASERTQSAHVKKRIFPID